jgi:hypothetical protein
MQKQMIEPLEGRMLFAITTTTVIKKPGPTDTVVVVATNPAGNQAVGQNDTFTVSNKDAKNYR